MNKLLTIEKVRPIAAAVEVTVDRYLPLAVTSSGGPLAVWYHTLGDRAGSYVELKIERTSRLVREVVLVSLQGVADMPDVTHHPAVEGLPIIAVDSVPEFRSHADRAVSVSLSADAVCIDWSAGTPIDFVTRQDRLLFLVGRDELLGALVTRMSSPEIEQLRKHAHPHK